MTGINTRMDKHSIRQSMRKLAEKVPPKFYMKLMGRDFVGVYYHVISDVPIPHVKHLYDYKSPAHFEQDLIYLQQHFNLIGYDALSEGLSNGTGLKRKSVILTFDDGFSECFSVVRPLLLEHKVPCTFFVTTDYVDNRGMSPDLILSLCIDSALVLEDVKLPSIIQQINADYGTELSSQTALVEWIKSLIGNPKAAVSNLCNHLGVDVERYLHESRPYLTSEEIVQLSKDGFTIGAHARSHRRMNNLSDDEIEAEIVESCRAVSALTGKEDIPFAFPYNGDGVSRELLENIRARYAHVGLFFNSRGFEEDRNFVVNRLCGDSPEGATPEESNLRQKINRSLLDEVSRKMHHAPKR
jgi:peptidoglycan/xylan/chitin deacetylase (PgdA/CDA1 family)